MWHAKNTIENGVSTQYLRSSSSNTTGDMHCRDSWRVCPAQITEVKPSTQGSANSGAFLLQSAVEEKGWRYPDLVNFGRLGQLVLSCPVCGSAWWMVVPHPPPHALSPHLSHPGKTSLPWWMVGMTGSGKTRDWKIDTSMDKTLEAGMCWVFHLRTSWLQEC